SNNVTAVKLLDAVGVTRSQEIAKKLGLPLDSSNKHLSQALGSISDGVKFSALASGYTALANSGVYAPLKFVESVQNRDGKTVFTRREIEHRAISDDTAYIITDMLKTCTKTGTANKIGASLNLEIASKTGTAEREGKTTNTDAYNISYTPYNTALVWHGNASMDAKNDLPKGSTGSGLTTYVTRDILEAIDKNVKKCPVIYNNSSFNRPPSVEIVSLDAYEYKNGNLVLANNFTPERYIKKEIFCKRFKPSEVSHNFIVNSAPEITVEKQNNIPKITFATLPHIAYEIYRNNTLLETIGGTGENYSFLDTTTLLPNIEYKYYVVAKCTLSLDKTGKQSQTEKVTLQAVKKQQKKQASKPVKKWFF
ncbi:MAG: penicillin-binding transpeptidase domain-containing protein, partial [Firmicutes bacterium]|nr:penicillin-binding transpeptidase domain-containing protein [Bacillota bacterium]